MPLIDAWSLQINTTEDIKKNLMDLHINPYCDGPAGPEQICSAVGMYFIYGNDSFDPLSPNVTLATFNFTSLDNVDGYNLILNSNSQSNINSDNIGSVMFYNAKQNGMNRDYDVTLVTYNGAEVLERRAAVYDEETDRLVFNTTNLGYKVSLRMFDLIELRPSTQ